MNSFISRVLARFTIHHLAQLSLLVQALIVLRMAGEYLRFKSTGMYIGTRLLDPIFLVIAAVAAAMMVSLILYFNRRELSVLALTVAGIAALVVFKLTAMPGLG